LRRPKSKKKVLNRVEYIKLYLTHLIFINMETDNINKVITALVGLCNKLDRKINNVLLGLSGFVGSVLVGVIVYYIVQGLYWNAVLVGVGLVIVLLVLWLVSLNMSRRTIGGRLECLITSSNIDAVNIQKDCVYLRRIESTRSDPPKEEQNFIRGLFENIQTVEIKIIAAKTMMSKGIYLDEEVEESIKKKPLETHEYDDLD